MKLIVHIHLILFSILLGFFQNKKNQSVVISKDFSGSLTVQSEPAIGLNLGNRAPEIVLKNPDGAIIKLSSLNGKMVLIDFWASWCGPCRRENPAVVKTYETFKDAKFVNCSGFTVYSVSLDMRDSDWKRAIEKDGLVWENHVSDLKGWYSEAAAKYGVTSIPTNFLVNEKGIIINKNLRGEELYQSLAKLAKQ